MILDQIVEHKKQEVRLLKANMSVKNMQYFIRSLPRTKSLVKAMKNASDCGSMGLIAEIKKGSPSKGIIRAEFEPLEIARTYTCAGASGISVLTDEKFFYGNAEYLWAVRQVTDVPLLRKDFIIDPWQVYESRYLGADVILLIAAILDDSSMIECMELAKELGLETLVEVHTEEELERVRKMPLELLGINNRDLKTFKTDLQTTISMSKKLCGTDFTIISESGINRREDVEMLKENGVHGILVGESLMREQDIASKVRELLGPEGVVA